MEDQTKAILKQCKRLGIDKKEAKAISEINKLSWLIYEKKISSDEMSLKLSDVLIKYKKSK